MMAATIAKAPESANRDESQAVVYEDVDFTLPANLLVAGTNVLAIQGLNISNTSSDLLIQPVPGQAGPHTEPAKRRGLVSHRGPLPTRATGDQCNFILEPFHL